MVAYRKERVENAICFFAHEYKKRTRKYPTHTYIYKLLAHFDFQRLKNTGQPAFDLEYRAMKNGPVPKEIYNKRHNYHTPLFSFVPKMVKQRESVFIYPKGKPDLDYFSEEEIDDLKSMAEVFIKSSIPSKVLSDASHQEGSLWDTTAKKEPNAIIDLADAFPGLLDKPDEEMTPQEINFLIYSGLKNGKTHSGRSDHSLE